MAQSQISAFIYQEKRGSERSNVETDAKGILPHLNHTLDCTVLDISETGARVELTNVDIVPETFKLFIPETHRLCECRVVRRSGRQLGLQFESQIDLKSAQDV